MLKKTPQFYEGAKAAAGIIDGNDPIECPYPKGSEEWYEWTAGYIRSSDLTFMEDELDPHRMAPAELEETLLNDDLYTDDNT
jgi:hypothetical protein